MMSPNCAIPPRLYWYFRPYFLAFGTASGRKPEPNIRVEHVRQDETGWKSSLLCHEPNRDIAYAVMTQDRIGRLHCVVTNKKSTAAFYDLGYLFSDDDGDTWSPIHPITQDANERRQSYPHPAISPVENNGKIQFVCNMWTGRKRSPIYYSYSEIDIAPKA